MTFGLSDLRTIEQPPYDAVYSSCMSEVVLLPGSVRVLTLTDSWSMCLSCLCVCACAVSVNISRSRRTVAITIMRSRSKPSLDFTDFGRRQPRDTVNHQARCHWQGAGTMPRLPNFTLFSYRNIFAPQKYKIWD